MKYLDRYTIPYKKYKSGTHLLDFEINDEFFKHIEDSTIEKASIKIDVKMKVESSNLSFEIHLYGNVNVQCDRCLDYIDVPVDYETKLFVKFEKTAEDLFFADDILTLSFDDFELPMAQHFYDFINLSLPIRRVHPPNELGKSTCNKEMLKKIKDLSVNKKNTEKPADPRWDGLKDLLN